MQSRILGASLLSALASASTALGQTNFPELEPNDTKAQANLVTGMTAGDTITGLSTGTATTGGTSATGDTFRISTAAAPLGIYFHRLTITTTGTAGHTGTTRGLNQMPGGVIGTNDVVIQTSNTTTAPPRTNTWYGFGKQEQIYYRVTGGTATTANYTCTLATTTVTPTVVAGSFAPGPITITSIGQTTIDTEIYIYDANLDPVPTAHNDDEGGTTSFQSLLTRTLAAGTYYAIVSDFNLCNSYSDVNPDEDFQTGPLLDFVNALVSSDFETAGNVDYDITISDGVQTIPVAQLGGSLANAVFARFIVGTAPPPVTTYCFGVGPGTACPCANNGAIGNGCANSVNANGARLAATGGANISADTFVLNGTGMPNSSALYFQGTMQVALGSGAIFGDGKRCVAGTVIRLGTKTNFGGASAYPVPPETSISVKGMNAAGNLRDYQCWYRNADPTYCTPSTFNLTNGLEVTWAL